MTCNICLNDLKKKISKKTKAILIVHVLGISTDMMELRKIVKKLNWRPSYLNYLNYLKKNEKSYYF